MADVSGGPPGAALVVGGASGIGRACSEALAAAGWTVRIADLSPEPGDGTALTLDVRDRTAIAAAVETLTSTAGALGAVVYSAGTARVTPLLDITVREWELVRSVNLDGAFHVLQLCAPHMARGASFTLVSSIDSHSPVPGLAHYCAAKAGSEALIRSAALELGPRGIRANAVLPGVVRTPLMNTQLDRPGVSEAFVGQTPLGAIAEPAEIADVVAFLASSAARWITGVCLPVDGGMSLREHPQLHASPTSVTSRDRERTLT
ncbi:MAG TPA: SDR family oxidoreductase [Solirubrobacteraceae bacterium]|nr:SDR family oxidoreductase [Solirubrobacteraceae bacterium]